MIAAMARKLPTYFEQSSEPVDVRIAVGLNKLGLAMKQETWKQSTGAGLSPTQGQILSSLSLDGDRTSTELAKTMGLTLPTVSDSVRVLVDKGLVAKRPDPRNARASLLSLTPAGRERAQRARSFPDYLASAAGALSPTEQEVFFTGLVKMIRTLQGEGKIPTNRMCVTCTHFRPHAHEGDMPHHCALVDAPMANRHLRIDCAEQEEAEEAQKDLAWSTFVGESPRLEP